MSDGSVKCWGKNDAGQADGIGTTSPLKKPVNVIGVTAASQISLAATTSGARLSDGSVKVWGSLDALLGTGGSKKAPTPVAGIAGATRFGLGSSGGTAAQSFGCYQTTSAFKCWGYIASGPLCDGSTSADLPPSFSMPAITALTTFWVTPNKLFGIAGGSAKACGENGSGELAIGSFTNATTPSASFTNVSAVAGGQSHSCAIKTDNTVVCAGYDGNGQLADGKYFGSSSTPVAVSGTANSVSIAAGANHTCVVALDGRVRCWGANGYGQLGDGSTTDSSSVVTVTGITTAKSVAATAATTCVLVADRNVSCWGDNSAGALGAALDPSTTPFSKSPVTVTF
jgi:alpha-tubulin suppressor-like RCC1 family protein